MILPCGCEMWKEGEVFNIKPCSENCQYYLHAINESKKRGNMIKLYKERIRKAQEEIKFCNDQIDRLNGLTEPCPHCKGEGKIGVGHSFRNGTIYTRCLVCNGKGKVTK